MRCLLLLTLGCLVACVGVAQSGGSQPASDTPAVYDAPGSNDHIFPAAASAKPFINFDAKGFLIGGKRVFLVSAGMEYARVPHELWGDRLLRLKRAGFNCIEIYTIWNFHEPREGHFDFSGDHDLEAFLRLVRKMDLYAIVRVGPYYCAEWDNGGYPLWLRFKPGVRVREDNVAFEQYVDRYFDRLLPIVNRQQIHRGGAVILVQLENEHPKGWGTVMPDGYFRHLREKALSLGLEVPYFFSGLHHASDPARERPAAAVAETGKPGEMGTAEPVAGGDTAALDDPARPNPWFSTEFWCVRYSGYGSTDKDARDYERRTWKIISHGGNGYNYYMAYGGSNFGYTNNDEDAASYDYGAAVGQTGDLRPIYYSFKRMGWFARSFADILGNSTDATAEWRSAFAKEDGEAGTILRRAAWGGGLVGTIGVKHDDPRIDGLDTALTVTARHSPAGDCIFLDNGADIFPIVHHFALDSTVTLEWAPVRVLGIRGQDKTTTIVIYGNAGSPAELSFSVRGKAAVLQGGDVLTADGQRVMLRAKFSDARTPAVYIFSVNGRKWRILAVNRQLADRTWFVEARGWNDVVCGPDYVGEVRVNNRQSAMIVEKPWSQHANVTRKTRLLLSPWQFRNGSNAAAGGYDDNDWLHSLQPLQMGADGDATADAWYRANIVTDTSGVYTLQVAGSDRATAFVDGMPAGTGNIRDGEMSFHFSKGRHVLAFFTAHDGRDKLAAYLGAMDLIDRKGLFGKAVLRRGGPSIVTLGGWHFLKDTTRNIEGVTHAGLPDNARTTGAVPKPGTVGWQDYTIGQDAFGGKEGRGWFRTVLPQPGAGVSEIVLLFKSVDEDATIFINGRRIGRHVGWNQPFEVHIGGLDTLNRPLELSLFIENSSKEGGIDKPVRANYAGTGKEVTEWCMRGGPGDPMAGGWKLLPTAATKTGPCFYRTLFTAPAYGVTGSHPIWRVHTDGLGHGSVWVNGHHLGRYPEKTTAPGMYIPECWLKPGQNVLTIFEEDGKYPGRVSIQAEKAASRDRLLWDVGL